MSLNEKELIESVAHCRAMNTGLVKCCKLSIANSLVLLIVSLTLLACTIKLHRELDKLRETTARTATRADATAAAPPRR